MVEALEFSFFQRALLAGLLASVACGIIGAYVVVKQISSISGGLSHAALGGVGVAYFFGINPIIGATIFSILSALGIGVAYRHQRHSLDTLIAMVWSLGMAIGIIFISLTPGYVPDLTSYLFGSILFVPQEYILLVLLLDVVVVGVVFFMFKEFQAVSFDEEYAEVMGVPVAVVVIVLLLLTALAVVTLIRIVGVIMLIALLTTPAVIARQWTDSLKGMMIFGIVLSAFSITSGLFLSYWLSESFGISAIPTGPLIILFVTCLYVISSILVRLLKRST